MRHPTPHHPPDSPCLLKAPSLWLAKGAVLIREGRVATSQAFPSGLVCSHTISLNRIGWLLTFCLSITSRICIDIMKAFLLRLCREYCRDCWVFFPWFVSPLLHYFLMILFAIVKILFKNILYKYLPLGVLLSNMRIWLVVKSAEVLSEAKTDTLIYNE